MACSKPALVDQDQIEQVRTNFESKKELILAHKKPWTPWALTYLLEIDDSQSLVPAEVILYKTLKASRPARHAIQNVFVQVNCNNHLLQFNFT